MQPPSAQAYVKGINFLWDGISQSSLKSAKKIKIGERFSKPLKRSYFLGLVREVQLRRSRVHSIACNKSVSLTKRKKYFSEIFFSWRKYYKLFWDCLSAKILKIAEKINPNKMLKFRALSEPRTLNPVKIYSLKVFRILSNIYDGYFCEKSQRLRAVNYFRKSLCDRCLTGS